MSRKDFKGPGLPGGNVGKWSVLEYLEMRAEEREGAEGGISGGTWESSDKTERRGEKGGLRLCCSQGRSDGYFKACSLVTGVGKFTNNDSR